MTKFVHWANRHLAGFTGWLMVVMMLLLIADVIARGAGAPLQGMAELSVFVMMIVVYLGFARCEEKGEHVSLEFALNVMPLRARLLMLAISQLIAVVTICLLFYGVVTDAWSSFLTNSAIEGTIEIPLWPTKFVMVVGMVFFVLQGIVNLGNAIRRFRQKDDAPQAHGADFM
ncbi:MAG: TRAP transporter small permease subunit [Rhodospirillales bacterium]|nr:TRAP transporter small permease subunit [Rhodospirillales bacterium]